MAALPNTTGLEQARSRSRLRAESSAEERSLQSLAKAIETLTAIEFVVTDMQPDGNPSLFAKMCACCGLASLRQARCPSKGPHERFVPFVLRRNTLVADLERIEKEGKAADILIPLQAVQCVNM